MIFFPSVLNCFPFLFFINKNQEVVNPWGVDTGRIARPLLYVTQNIFRRTRIVKINI